MCGIIGYIGKNDATKKIINTLERLEYRGYDSAGIAYYDGKIHICSDNLTQASKFHVAEFKKYLKMC